MKIIHLLGSGHVYSSNVYLILGEWKRIEDMNTLIDVGNDPDILHHLDLVHTGAGKKKIEQVVLTHDHFDHTAILPLIRERYKPKVFAFSPHLKGVDHVVEDGERLRIGDREFEVIHAPGHSSDSISLINDDEGVLFVGDNPVIVHSEGVQYEDGFVHALKNICQRNVQQIYFGHGAPVREGAKSLLTDSLATIRKANGKSKHNCPAL